MYFDCQHMFFSGLSVFEMAEKTFTAQIKMKWNVLLFLNCWYSMESTLIQWAGPFRIVRQDVYSYFCITSVRLSAFFDVFFYLFLSSKVKSAL